MVFPNPTCKNAILIDDQLSIRELLRLFFQQNMAGCQVVDEAGSATTAISIVEKHRPDIIITDVFLPDMAAVPFVSEIRRISPSTRIIAFCRWLDPAMARRLLSAGVSGIAAKEESLLKLQTAINSVLHGGCYVPSGLESTIYAEMQQGGQLTERETEVLRLIAEGFATKEVGSKLSISVKTAEKYRERIMAKLKVHDAVRLTHYAIRHGLAAL